MAGYQAAVNRLDLLSGFPEGIPGDDVDAKRCGQCIHALSYAFE
jgi:hypothetical protein